MHRNVNEDLLIGLEALLVLFLYARNNLSRLLLPICFLLNSLCVMTSSYAHVMDRQATISNRLESPITSNLENLQAKKNFSVSHLLDLEEAGEMVGTQTDESTGEAGRSMLESPGLTSGSDTTQQESKCEAYSRGMYSWDCSCD